MATYNSKVNGVIFNAEVTPAYAEILTPEAVSFIATLHRKFNARRLELLEKRQERQAEIDKGKMPDFLPETKHIREGNWTVAPLPEDLLDRRVEITGPVDRKMVINALNSGAKVFMTDFEDANSPTWSNNLDGQINLRDAVRKSISYTNPKTGKAYKLNDKTATLLVRPRGWHLNEKHMLVDGEQMSGSLFDFGLYFFHNAKESIARGTGPYFYLPKMESHLEARLWNDAFVWAQDEIGIPQSTIKATVLIETILASFEMDEILYELKEHSCGLNCGRWDYIFSYIKRLRNTPNFVVPNRAQVGMTAPFMKAYSELVIKTCHKRNVHAMGGMAAQIPIKGDEQANNSAIEKVRNDKLREVKAGHDGTWVAHPALVKVAIDVFDEYMPTPNQIHIRRDDVNPSAADLIEIPKGTITEAGIRANINVGILYIEAWLNGIGAAALHHLMEDAATAEISRTQLWQWIQSKAKMDDGRVVTYALCKDLFPSEIDEIKAYVGIDRYKNGRFKEAIDIFDQLIKDDKLVEFLTLPAYEKI